MNRIIWKEIGKSWGNDCQLPLYKGLGVVVVMRNVGLSLVLSDKWMNGMIAAAYFV
jgi:hypothetical protein